MDPYSQVPNMAGQQKPETFLLTPEAEQALPQESRVALEHVDALKYFLISAPVDWQGEHFIRRYLLPTGDYISCVMWNNLYHISGTDIVRVLSFRFQAFGRPVKNSKKFEEGIFSDLRNLKAGTDATLEEPKSLFLDFLYKSNCIRTQKKQKVFYWYSVPHDRLFLDALERDLKREKAGQEATTEATNEPALSFKYDSSQSLFEQLTKKQQANISSVSAQPLVFPLGPSQNQSMSPAVQAMDSMPPPQMVGQMPQVNMVETPQPMAPLPDAMNPMVSYGAMGMGHSVNQQGVKQEHDLVRLQYTQNGVPITGVHQRHASMPAYGLEYSPAPSFVSSQYEDYSQRGISYEPITPPQPMGMGGEPTYIANEETNLYTAIPDHLHGSHAMNGMVQLPPSNLAGPSFSRPYGTNNVYPVIEGSPTYKQRRRRSSIPPSVTAAIASATAAHRSNDYRRSVSASVGPVAEGGESADNSPPGLTYSNSGMSLQQQRDTMDLSRHGTPLSTVDNGHAVDTMGAHHQHQHHKQVYSQLGNEDMTGLVLNDQQQQQVMRHGGPGLLRRARSATVAEQAHPYARKEHSCPIPMCGRSFKRLEHLKRHVRTHTHERPYICPICSKAFSRSDNLAQHKRTHDRGDGAEGSFNPEAEEEEYSGEDPLGALEEGSPTSETETSYVMSSRNPGPNGHVTPLLSGMMNQTGMPNPHVYNSLQTLSMPMTMSQPQSNDMNMKPSNFDGMLFMKDNNNQA